MLRHLPLGALYMSPGEVFDKSEPTDWSIWYLQTIEEGANRDPQLIATTHFAIARAGDFREGGEAT
jgi:hypothetical protein